MSEEVRRIHATRREQRAQLPQASGLDLADALAGEAQAPADRLERLGRFAIEAKAADRKSTRLNSSHSQISYAVFCLKKKKIYRNTAHRQTRQHALCGGAQI